MDTLSFIIDAIGYAIYKLRILLLCTACAVIAGLLMALGMLYCPAITITIVMILWLAGFAYILIESIPILFGDPDIEVNHQRRKY